MTQPAASNDLLCGEIAPTLRTMTLPVIIGMITMMTFNLVDTFFISLLGTQPLAAVSFTFPVTFSVISLSIGLSIGTSAVIARMIGQQRRHEAKNYATAALYLSAFSVLLLCFLGYSFSYQLFRAMGASDTLYTLIMQYMTVWFAGSVMLILPMICNAIFRANGETRLPSYMMAGAGLINALLDPLLIFGLGPIPALGIQGAAIASVCSWSIAAFVILYILAHRQRRIYYFPADWSQTVKAWKEIAAIGLPAAGASMLTPIAMGIMTAMVASYGEPVVAAFGVGSRIESIASIVVLALSMTLPPFISQNFGAGQLQRAQTAYRLSVRFVLVWQLLIALLLITLSGWLVTWFSSAADVQHALRWYVCIMPVGYGLQAVVILANSSFNALHRPHQALQLSLVRFFLFFIPMAFVGGELYGFKGLFIGAVMGNFCTALLAWYGLNKTMILLRGEEV